MSHTKDTQRRTDFETIISFVALKWFILWTVKQRSDSLPEAVCHFGSGAGPQKCS